MFENAKSTKKLRAENKVLRDEHSRMVRMYKLAAEEMRYLRHEVAANERFISELLRQVDNLSAELNSTCLEVDRLMWQLDGAPSVAEPHESEPNEMYLIPELEPKRGEMTDDDKVDWGGPEYPWREQTWGDIAQRLNGPDGGPRE